jgi:ribonuclease P protein component
VAIKNARRLKSTQRNRFKRRIRAIFSLHKQKIAPGFDIVILAWADTNVVDLKFSELEEELCRLLRKSGLLI